MAHQTSPILTTKLFVARPQTTVVQREGLIARLDDILRRRITLISAPAGFGKTTAIGTWIDRRRIPTSWVSLDAADNDVARFLLYLVAAFQTIHPELGEGVRRALLSPVLPPIEPLLASLINDLATITDDYLLVLDDYHLISDQEVHDALLFILERAPASLHTILTTRADPPVPLARLRVRGDLLEIRASDLRFSSEEAGRFLNEQMGLHLTSGQLDILQAKTEGWAAGLQMAALSLQGRSDVDGFISTFTGADRFVIDYLLEEVLALLPEELQRIMLELSMLDRFNGPLCEAVTGCGSGSDLLADLERRNLFLVSLDNRREWYRYHHLFADLLYRRLRQQRPESLPELHRRASVWFDAQGDVVNAIEHASRAGDPHLLERMLRTYWHEVLNMYGHIELLERLAGLPSEILESSPILLMINAWGLVSDWKFDMAIELLDKVERGLQGRADAEARELTGHVYLLRAVTSRDSGRPEEAIRYAEKAFGLLPDLPATSPKYISNASRATLLSILAGSYALAGEAVRAEEIARQALQTSQASGDDFTIAIAYSNVSREQMGIGRLTAAERSALEMGEHLKKMLFRIDNIAASPYQVRARVHAERFELDAALELALQAVDQACVFRPTQVIEMNRILFTVQDARHDWSEAQRTIERMEGVVLAPHEARVAGLMPLLRAQLKFRMGDLASAIRWTAERFEGGIPEGEEVQRLNMLHQLEFVFYGRVLIEQKRFAEAAPFLEALAASYARDQLFALQLEAMVLRAIALQGNGETAAAVDLLIEALRTGAPEGFIRPFAYEPEPVARLLAQLQKRPTVRLPAAYLRRVMEACGLGIPVEAAAEGAADRAGGVGDGPDYDGANRGIVVEDMIPLTSREEEILRLLGQGYSNQKIADKLYVSINTVKTHVSNLFEKLGASSRVEALLRARSAKLL